jgi:hypothetical protein
MTASPKVLKMTPDPYPKVTGDEVNIKGSIGREALKNPPSSNTRSRRRPNILEVPRQKYYKNHTKV